MALKGSAVIELTDTKTGQKKVIRHDNLITNAINDILSTDPLNLRLDAGLELRSRFFPIVGRLIEGIVLFADPLEEDPAKYYAPGSNGIVGYSNMEVSPNTDERRGSMNQTESGVLEDGKGYRFVFDFSTSQGNGQISALALTSNHMGACGYSSKQYADVVTNSDVANFASRKAAFRAIGDITWSAESYADSSINSRITSMDIASGNAYSVVLAAANSIRIYKIPLLTTTAGLFPVKPFQTESKELVASISTTAFCSTYVPVYNYVTFVDDGYGYIWGFSTGNASESKTINWVKIKKADWTFEEGVWTVPVKVSGPGVQSSLAMDGTVNIRNHCYCLAYKGFAYFMKSDYLGVVVINLENPADITVLESESRLDPERVSTGGNCFFNVLGDVIYLSGAHIADNELHLGYPRTSGYYLPGLFGSARPSLRYGPMVFGISGGSSLSNNLRMYIDNAYLATINNLDTPVTKTADKTMKITYILREE